MALDVARLIARLEVDDSKLNRGLDTAERRLRQLDASARDANQSLQRIEIPSGIARAAQDAQQQIGRVETSARQAGDGIEQASRGAQRQIDQIGESAKQASRDVEGMGAASERASKQMRDSSGRFASAGQESGGNFVSGFKDKLGDLASKSGPVAGSLIGIAVLGVAAGAMLASAIQQGMQQELTRDIFQARTGVTEAQARKFGLAAGESYADAFGDSVEANLDTAKLALKAGLLDPASTQREAEAVINSLSGVADVMEIDIPSAAKTAGQMIKTGLASDFTEAMDLLTTAAQSVEIEGGDIAEVFASSSATLTQFGLTGQQSLGMFKQAIDAGAPSADFLVGALEELAGNAGDSADAFNELGLDGEDMGQRLTGGGERAAEGLDMLLDKLREIEDPAERSTAFVALFGEEATAMQEALLAVDVSSAAQQLGNLEGAGQRAINIMGDNSATSVSGAMRGIGVIADGLKGALAEAFGPKIQEFANMIANNRAGVIEFFTSLGNGAFEAATAILGFAASGLEAFANVTEMGTKMVVGILKGLAAMASGFDVARGVLGVFGVEVPSVSENISKLASSLEEFSDDAVKGMKGGATAIREDIIPIVEEAHGRFQEFAGDQKLSAAFNDQAQKVNSAIGEIGIGIDGASIKIDNWTGAIDRSNVQQVAMETGLRGMVDQFREQTRTGLEAGKTVETLTAQYAANRDALIQQLMATGMGNEAAVDYLNSLGLIPNLVETQISQPGMPESHYAMDVLKDKVVAIPDGKTIETTTLTEDAIAELVRLGLTVTALPNGNISVTAGTAEAEAAMVEWINRKRSVTVDLALRRSYWQDQGVSPELADQIQGPVPMVKADGGVTASYADGKLPDQAIVQPARGSRGLIQWAERETDGEAFIPFAASKRPRSLKIWAEAGKRLGAIKMADGGVLDSMIAIQQQVSPELQMTSGVRSEPGSHHNDGHAGDFSNGSGNTDEQLRFAQHMADNYASQLAELIYDDPRFAGREIKDGKFVDASFYDAAGDHTNHVHVASLTPLAAAGGATPGGGPDNRTSKQRNVDTVIAEGRRRGMSDKQIKTAVMALLAEAGGEDPGDAPGSEYDSEGGFQQRPSMGWGPAEEDLATDAGQFYDRLAAVPGAENMTEAQLAQAVQRSAHADGSNYAAQEAAAMQAIAESSGSGSPSASASASPSSTAQPGSDSMGDGSRVFVTNWPTALGGGEKTPIATFSAKLFGSGGIEDHTAQISSGMRIWAEPETQGEAYIPFAQSKRQRSLAIWAETGKRLGVTGYADGGGFGGYTGPDTEDHMKPKNWYDALALGTGLAFTAASGLSGIASMAQSGTVDLGNIIPSFDTSNTTIPGLSEAFEQLVEPLNKILETLKQGGLLDAKIDVDTNTGAVNASLSRAGMA